MGETVKLDLRGVAVVEKHPRIFDSWEALRPGSTLQITNEHDLKALHHQFESSFADQYAWGYEQEGPEEWVINLKKLEVEGPSPETLVERIEEALSEVRPYLQADGGDVEFVGLDADKKRVQVQLTGACGGCPSAQLTLKGGVERAIKKYAPEIEAVDSV